MCNKEKAIRILALQQKSTANSDRPHVSSCSDVIPLAVCVSKKWAWSVWCVFKLYINVLSTVAIVHGILMCILNAGV